MSITKITGTVSNIINSPIENSDTLYPEFKCRAWVNFNGTTANNVSGIYSQSGTLVTATITNHGLSIGHSIYVDITSGSGVDGIYTVNGITGTNVFSYVAGTSLNVSGNITLNRRLIRGSGNVSNVSYNGTGDYTVNFIIPMPDANYSVNITVGDTSSPNPNRNGSIKSAFSVNSFTIVTGVPSTGLTADMQYVCASVYR